MSQHTFQVIVTPSRSAREFLTPEGEGAIAETAVEMLAAHRATVGQSVEFGGTVFGQRLFFAADFVAHDRVEVVVSTEKERGMVEFVPNV